MSSEYTCTCRNCVIPIPYTSDNLCGPCRISLAINRQTEQAEEANREPLTPEQEKAGTAAGFMIFLLFVLFFVFLCSRDGWGFWTILIGSLAGLGIVKCINDLIDCV